jgi:hypothetical protein
MQRRLSSQATSVGVNGDYFAPADGRPSGVTLRDGVLATAPVGPRSSLGVRRDGLLDIRRVSFRATWRGRGQRRSITYLNRAPGANGISLFTPAWGRTTPALPGSQAVVLSDFPPATAGKDIVSPVTAVYANARVGIAPGTAVLLARGNAAVRLRDEAPVGSSVTVRLILQPAWDEVTDAIGGGPLLVRDGAPVYRANEAFTISQLAPRGPRSAVGQRADGSLVLVATDGSQSGYSVGMTNFELAQTLARLGAVRGMALDGGASSTLAFEGTLLNRPSAGAEREIANALLLQYHGVYALPPAAAVVSPNGDGVAETQELAYKLVRPSTVSVTLTAPGGAAAFQESAIREPGTYPVSFPPPPPDEEAEPLPLAEGRWTLTVNAADDQRVPSTAVQRFAVNSTLGFLRVEPPRLVLPPAGAAATVRWTQTRPARVRVTVETPEGVPVRTLVARTLEAGAQTAAWNGRHASGQLAAGGRYVVRVEAANALGEVELVEELTVRRVRSG